MKWSILIQFVIPKDAPIMQYLVTRIGTIVRFAKNTYESILL